jgi:hypothetical protein
MMLIQLTHKVVEEVELLLLVMMQEVQEMV